MIEEFLTQADDSSFREWRKQNANGFYLNEGQPGNIKHGAGKMILHRVSCHHLGSGESFVSTTYGKAVSSSHDALVGWAQGKGLTVSSCSSCKPDE